MPKAQVAGPIGLIGLVMFLYGSEFPGREFFEGSPASPTYNSWRGIASRPDWLSRWDRQAFRSRSAIRSNIRRLTTSTATPEPHRCQHSGFLLARSLIRLA